MKIIDFLIDSASLLGLTDEVTVLSNATEDMETQILQDNKNINSLFNLIKFSIRELCSNYVPMISNVTITTTNKSLAMSSLENCVRINNITLNGSMVKFKTINRNLVFEEDGEYLVNYATYPTINSLFEHVDFLQELSPDVIVFGLCSYFSLAHGLFDEFHDFHEKYTSKAQSLKHLRSFNLSSRRWE